MKPFLLLGTRPEDSAADSEYMAFLSCGNLSERDLRQHRMERRPLGSVNLNDWSGIILGGGPFNYSDSDDSKSVVQRRIESELFQLLDRVIDEDYPFLGTCYGVGILGSHQGAVVGRQYGEPVGPVRVSLTVDGQKDPLFCCLPTEFDAFTGHKEAICTLPFHAVHLAASDLCPFQALRVGQHVYAMQFHPELDVAGFCLRIEVYKNAGYFQPEEIDRLKRVAHRAEITHPSAIVRRFVARYARPAVAPAVCDC